jgi:hypothetical protein
MSRPDTAALREAVASWLKIIGTLFSIIGVVVMVTLYVSNQDKRITLLETTVAQEEARDAELETTISANSNRIGTIEKWVPAADFKLNLLLKHFGIPVPKDTE